MVVNITKIFYRQGLSYASTVIDGYLNDANDCQALYDTWVKHPDWPEMLEFQGGIKAITAEAILEVPQDTFVEALAQVMRDQSKRDGKKADPIKVCKDRARAVYDAAEQNVG